MHLNFSKSCNYITEEEVKKLLDNYNEIGKMLKGMMDHPEKFNRVNTLTPNS